jgi:hypothetical protein
VRAPSCGCGQASGVSCVWTGCRGGSGCPDPGDRRPANPHDGGRPPQEEAGLPAEELGGREPGRATGEGSGRRSGEVGKRPLLW